MSMESGDNDEEEYEIEEEEEEILSSNYFETDYSTPSCTTSTKLSTFPPTSVSTKDFQDSSASLSTKITDEYVKRSIAREFSREFQKTKHSLTDITKLDEKVSSELLFKKIKCSHCSDDSSILSSSLLLAKIERSARKEEEIKIKREGILANTLILPRFYDLFQIPVSDKYLKKICFKENLIISYDPGCDAPMNFGKSDLELNPAEKHLISDFSERVGEFSLRIEEADQQFITYCNSQLSINDSIAGSTIISIIADDFAHIEEKKTEWYYENEKKIEKALHVVMENENYVAFLDHKDLCKVTSRRGELNLKSSGDFLQDGGVYVLMRYLILTDYIGTVQFWTLDINGKMGLCKMDVGVHRKIIINSIAYITIRVKKELFRANCKKEVSKTYFLSTGHIVLHKWKACSYYLHLDNTLPSIPAKINWNLSNDWMNDMILSSQFDDEKNSKVTDIKTYFDEHPQIKNLLHDYLLFLLQLKPENVLEYSINFFLNMFRDYK